MTKIMMTILKCKAFPHLQLRNILDAAKSAIKNRVKPIEPMHEFIEKKREMLLF
jgi:hypothetical protein